jgi:hypothetical protein
MVANKSAEINVIIEIFFDFGPPTKCADCGIQCLFRARRLLLFQVTSLSAQKATYWQDAWMGAVGAGSTLN